MYICIVVRCKGMKYFNTNQIFHEIFSKKIFIHLKTKKKMKEKVTGEMLLQRRSELRLSRIDVAKMFGVTERTIINWENG